MNSKYLLVMTRVYAFGEFPVVSVRIAPDLFKAFILARFFKDIVPMASAAAVRICRMEEDVTMTFVGPAGGATDVNHDNVLAIISRSNKTEPWSEEYPGDTQRFPEFKKFASGMMLMAGRGKYLVMVDVDGRYVTEVDTLAKACALRAEIPSNYSPAIYNDEGLKVESSPVIDQRVSALIEMETERYIAELKEAGSLQGCTMGVH